MEATGGRQGEGRRKGGAATTTASSKDLKQYWETSASLTRRVAVEGQTHKERWSRMRPGGGASASHKTARRALSNARASSPTEQDWSTVPAMDSLKFRGEI
jgi:hypothetical protein